MGRGKWNSTGTGHVCHMVGTTCGGGPVIPKYQGPRIKRLFTGIVSFLTGSHSLEMCVRGAVRTVKGLLSETVCLESTNLDTAMDIN